MNSSVYMYICIRKYYYTHLHTHLRLHTSVAVLPSYSKPTNNHRCLLVSPVPPNGRPGNIQQRFEASSVFEDERVRRNPVAPKKQEPYPKL